MKTKYGRKASGGRYKKARKKKLYEKRGAPREVILASEKKRIIRCRGGNIKTVLLACDKANIFIKKENKAKIAKILNVLEVPSNRFLARKNVLCKGAVIQTEIGKAKITNRPSQEAQVQAVLIE